MLASKSFQRKMRRTCLRQRRFCLFPRKKPFCVHVLTLKRENVAVDSCSRLCSNLGCCICFFVNYIFRSLLSSKRYSFDQSEKSLGKTLSLLVSLCSFVHFHFVCLLSFIYQIVLLGDGAIIIFNVMLCIQRFWRFVSLFVFCSMLANVVSLCVTLAG